MLNALNYKRLFVIPQQWLLYLVGAIVGILTLIVLIQLGMLISSVKLYFQPTLLAVTSTKAIMQKTEVKPTVDLTQLTRLALFGDIAVSSASLEDIPKTSLSIILSGVLVHNEAKQSYAIITFADGKEESYRLGEEVPEVGKIHAISAQGIVLLRNGQFESLMFADEEDNKEKIHS